MKVKRFIAARSRDALRQVREALGPDAVILSNRSVDGRVVVLAVSAADMAASVTPIEARAVPKSEFTVTPPFKDPVQAKTSAASGAPSPRNTAELENELKAMRSLFENQLAALTHAAAAQQSLAQREAAGQTALERERDELAAEIRSLRAQVQQSLATVAWGDAVRRAPLRTEAMRRLLGAGYSASLVRSLVTVMPEELDGAQAGGWLAATLTSRLLCAGEELVDRGGVYALVGPTGAGKTTSIAKIAARFVVKYSAANLGLISTDFYRIGAQDQLRTYGRILGVPVASAQDPAGLASQLEGLRDKRLVLIDTVGMGQRDERVAEQTALLGDRTQRLLALPAPAQGETLEDVVAAYRGNGLAGAVLTKVDEAVQLGGALDVLLRHRLPLNYVANGQRVPEDLHLPDARFLVHRSLRRRADSPFVLRPEELGAILSRPTASRSNGNEAANAAG